MTSKDARRVARFHATNPSCTPFRDAWAQFTPATWWGHFEADLRTIDQKADKREPRPGEVERIEAFIAGGRA